VLVIIWYETPQAQDM